MAIEKENKLIKLSSLQLAMEEVRKQQDDLNIEINELKEFIEKNYLTKNQISQTAIPINGKINYNTETHEIALSDVVLSYGAETSISSQINTNVTVYSNGFRLLYYNASNNSINVESSATLKTIINSADALNYYLIAMFYGYNLVWLPSTKKNTYFINDVDFYEDKENLSPFDQLGIVLSGELNITSGWSFAPSIYEIVCGDKTYSRNSTGVLSVIGRGVTYVFFDIDDNHQYFRTYTLNQYNDLSDDYKKGLYLVGITYSKIGNDAYWIYTSTNKPDIYFEDGVDIYGDSEPVQDTKRITMTKEDTEVDLKPNTLYLFPSMESLSVTLAAPTDENIVNEYHFMFTSGEIATELTLPETVISDLAVEPNRRYEISIIDNLLSWTSWAV